MTMNATQRRTGSSAISALLLIFAAPGDADAVVHKLHVPGVTMSQARGSANCADWNWPSSEFGLVYQDCHQLYGRLDFVRGAKTLRKLTLVGRDFAQPQNIVVRLLRKRFDDPTATFTYPELVVEVTTTGSIDALRAGRQGPDRPRSVLLLPRSHHGWPGRVRRCDRRVRELKPPAALVPTHQPLNLGHTASISRPPRTT
jgi:hypothetical protein